MERKHILITGADGNIGRQVVKMLLRDPQYLIDALVMRSSDMKNAVEVETITDTERLQIITNADFFADSYQIDNYDTAVHLAFARADKSNEDIASSLDYEVKLLERLKNTKLRRIVYISSQGIYGKTEQMRFVGMAPAPASVYTMAKYSGEKLLEAYYGDSSQTSIAILRLDNVIQSQNLVKSLCTSALQQGEIRLKGGKQCFSYIDVEDAGAAISSVIRKDKWEKKLYNVGPNQMRVTLIQVAETVQKVARKYGKQINILIEEDETTLWAGMETADFLDEFQWKPQYTFEEMVERVYCLLA